MIVIIGVSACIIARINCLAERLFPEGENNSTRNVSQYNETKSKRHALTILSVSFSLKPYGGNELRV